MRLSQTCCPSSPAYHASDAEQTDVRVEVCALGIVAVHCVLPSQVAPAIRYTCLAIDRYRNRTQSCLDHLHALGAADTTHRGGPPRMPCRRPGRQGVPRMQKEIAHRCDRPTPLHQALGWLERGVAAAQVSEVARGLERDAQAPARGWRRGCTARAHSRGAHAAAGRKTRDSQKC